MDLELWALAALVVSSFAATNTDNLILLVVLMGAHTEERAIHALGFLSSAIAVLCLAALGAVLGAGVDPAPLGYLGLIPLAMGAYLLLQPLWKRDGKADGINPLSPGSAGGSWLATTVLMFSNSTDSLAVFLPLLTESDRDSLLWEVSIFLLASLLWVLLAWRISDQPQLARRIEAVGERLVPWIMMLAGAYVLANTGTDTMLGNWITDM